MTALDHRGFAAGRHPLALTGPVIKPPAMPVVMTRYFYLACRRSENTWKNSKALAGKSDGILALGA